MVQSLIKPKMPFPREGWQQVPVSHKYSLGYPISGWIHVKGFFVLSAVEVATIETELLGPEYHISVSKNQQRCSSNKADWVVKQFDLEGATEDNHVPHGFVRNFWRPVAENKIGYECPCQDSEPVIKANKGDFIWRPAPEK